MSFRLFTIQLLGKLKSAEKIETERATLWADYQEFITVDRSDELKEYYKLEKFVNSVEFKNRMKTVKAEVFKGSSEFNQLREFEKLKRAKQIINFLNVGNSADLKRYKSLNNTDKLKQYYDIEDFVNKGQYQKEKKEIESQIFKGSVEEQHLNDLKRIMRDPGIKAWLELHKSSVLNDHIAFSESEKLKTYNKLHNLPDKDKEKKAEFLKLRKDQQIKNYFRFEHSKKLRLYHETTKSHTLVKYRELKKLTESESFLEKKKFLEDKTKFERSETNQKFRKYIALKSDPDIEFYLKFGESKAYKKYLDTKDSFELKRYHELGEITVSKDFIERKAYLEDTRKWEKTKEYANEQKYQNLKKLPHFIKYFSYLGKNSFDFFKTWEVSFDDKFQGNKLDYEKWITNSFWANKLLGKNFSLAGDLQCYTDGKNITTGVKGLGVQVKKEKVEGIVWKPGAGFIPTGFDYTSGILSTAAGFWQKGGIFEVKVRYNPVKEIASSIILSGEKNNSRLILFEQGAKNRAGVLKNGADEKLIFSGLNINNLTRGKSYIFSLRWDNNMLDWAVNERILYSCPSSGIDYSVHLNISSLVVYELPASSLPAVFEIEWIKCYRKKQN